VHAKKLQKGVEVKLQLFLTSALYVQIHTSAYLLQGKRPQYPLSRRLVGSRSGWSLLIRKKSVGNKNMKIDRNILYIYIYIYSKSTSRD
jgi:hypothetical protein